MEHVFAFEVVFILFLPPEVELLNSDSFDDLLDFGEGKNECAAGLGSGLIRGLGYKLGGFTRSFREKAFRMF